jgi:hypothetical protein
MLLPPSDFYASIFDEPTFSADSPGWKNTGDAVPEEPVPGETSGGASIILITMKSAPGRKSA